MDISVYAMPTVTSASAPIAAAPAPSAAKRAALVRKAEATTVAAVAGFDPDAPARRLDTYA